MKKERKKEKEKDSEESEDQFVFMYMQTIVSYLVLKQKTRAAFLWPFLRLVLFINHSLNKVSLFLLQLLLYNEPETAAF